jgi:hypothetical protein
MEVLKTVAEEVKSREGYFDDRELYKEGIRWKRER